MSMNKKFILLVLVSIPFCLASCGSNNSHNSGDNSSHDSGDNTSDSSGEEIDERSDCTGLIVEKTKTNYVEGEQVSIDDLKVYLTNANNSKKIEIDDYTVSYWQDAKDVGDISNVTAGRYQIWVEARATENGSLLSSFEFIYVDVQLSSFKVDTTIGEFTQKAGEDVMMNTWRFNVTYVNGSQRQLSMASHGISYPKDSYSTLTSGSGSLLVTYTEENGSSRSTLVNYTVTE